MIKFLAITALSLLFSASLAMAQESSPYPSVDAPSGHGPSAASSGTGAGKSNSTGSTPQTCTASCNRSYDGCMDHNAAIPGNDFTLNSSNNAANNLIGGSSDCSDDLRKCLNTCGG